MCDCYCSFHESLEVKGYNFQKPLTSKLLIHVGVLAIVDWMLFLLRPIMSALPPAAEQGDDQPIENKRGMLLSCFD